MPISSAGQPVVALPSDGFGTGGSVRSNPPAGWPAGSASWCCATWMTPVATSAGDVVGRYAVQIQDNAPLGSDPGNQLVLELRVQSGLGWQPALTSRYTDGSGAVQSLDLTLQTPHTMAAGESLFLAAVESTGFGNPVATHASTIGPVTVTSGPPPVPPPGTGSIYYHVVSSAAAIVGGAVPSPFSTQLIVGTNTTAVYPLNGLANQTITAIRVYMAQTPTGHPTYDVVSDQLSSSGFSGWSPIPGTSTSGVATVLTMTGGLPLQPTSPIGLRIVTDASSTTSVGAIIVDYSVPAQPGTLHVSPQGFIGLDGATVSIGTSSTLHGGGAVMVEPIPLYDGYTVSSIRVYVPTSTGQAVAFIGFTDQAGTTHTIATSPPVDASASPQIAVIPMSMPASGHNGYWVGVKTLSNPGACTVSGTEVDIR